MHKLKAGILGAGLMGTRHAKNLTELSDKVKITAICSQPLSTASELNQNLLKGKALEYEDFDKMLAECPLDILYICLPPYAHQQEVEKAAANGINIFIEKPIALTTEKAKSMWQAVKETDVQSQVGYHYRFSSPIEKLKEKIVNGDAGRPTLFQARYYCNSLHKEWWRDINLSGGQIFEQIIHLYDLALYLFGDVKEVAAYKDNLCHQDVENYSIEDTSAALLKFKSGALGSIVGSNCAIPDKWEAELMVICENLTVKFKSPETAEFIYTTKEPLITEKVISEENLYLQETKNFVDSILESKATLSPVKDGYKGVELVTAVVESARKRKFISIDESS